MPDVTHIADALTRAGVDATSVESVEAIGVLVRVAPGDLRGALTALRDGPHEYVYPVDVFGIDTGEGIDVVYHLRSLMHAEDVVVKAEHPYSGELCSMWELYPAALMPEREIAEMFGLTLEGHPNPKHLLLTKGVEPLLLKSVAIRTAEEVRHR